VAPLEMGPRQNIVAFRVFGHDPHKIRSTEICCSFLARGF